jgi:hypothetical protein
VQDHQAYARRRWCDWREADGLNEKFLNIT